MFVLFTIWYTGGDVLDIDNMISIFLGFVAIFLTLFFVNLDRTRRIKTEHSAAHHLGFMLRNMAISLREIKEEMDKAKVKCDDDTTKINNKLNKLFHHIRFLHNYDQCMSAIDILSIHNNITKGMLTNLGDIHEWYYEERDQSAVMEGIYQASLQIEIVLRLDWRKRYDAWSWGNIADLIVRDHIRDGKSYNELMSSAKQSRYGSDANRATPI